MQTPPDPPRRRSPLVSTGIGFTALLAFLAINQALGRFKHHEPGGIMWLVITMLLAAVCLTFIRRRNTDAND